MKIIIFSCVLFALTGCMGMTSESPTKDMAEAQISQLSDRQLCELRKGYQYEPKLEVEIGKRDIECTEDFLSCKQQGYKQHTPEFQSCLDYASFRNSLADIWDNILKN